MQHVASLLVLCNESPPPLPRAATRTPVLLVIQLPLACTQFGLSSLVETFLSWDCATPDSVFLSSWCYSCLPCPPWENWSDPAWVRSSSLELGHLSQCIKWHMSNYQLGNLENWSHLSHGELWRCCNREEQSPWFILSSPSPTLSSLWKTSNLLPLPYLRKGLAVASSKSYYYSFFCILIALLRYDLHTITFIHVKCTI